MIPLKLLNGFLRKALCGEIFYNGLYKALTTVIFRLMCLPICGHINLNIIKCLCQVHLFKYHIMHSFIEFITVLHQPEIENVYSFVRV